MHIGRCPGDVQEISGRWWEMVGDGGRCHLEEEDELVGVSVLELGEEVGAARTEEEARGAHLVRGRFMEGSWQVHGRFIYGSWKVH